MRLPLILAVSLAATAAAQRDTLAGPGVSIELARYRAATVSDVRYDLQFDLMKTDTAFGRVTIRWKRTGSGDAIIDFRSRRRAVVVNGTVPPPASFNGSHFVIPASLLVEGENRAEFLFETPIAASGASIIKSHDPDGSDYL